LFKPVSYFIIVLFSILFYPLAGQNESNIWYFGNKAGLDFSTNPPTALSSSSLNTLEGCTNICDSSGHIVLYTDGINFWNKNDSLIGTAFSANYIRTQSAVIVLHKTTFYIIAIENGYGLIKYSSFDMTLNGGLGGFTLFDYHLNPGINSNTAGDKITTVTHSNGRWTWVLVHSVYNNFYAHLVDSASIHVTPVTSTIGTNIFTYPFLFKGYMKVSPDGKRIGMAVTTKSICEIFKFDASTGIVSDSLVLSNTIDGVYGCEFSPDATKFYASSWSTGYIYQWNLCAGSDSAIIASQQIVGYCSSFAGAMQQAKNGKIYIANYNSNFLSVINNPNAPGLACNFQNAAQSIGNAVSYYGLPNFNGSYFLKPQVPPLLLPSNSTTICSGETITLSVSGLYNYTWNNSDTSLTFVVSPTVTSSYTVAGTNTLNTCPSRGVILVNVSECTNIESQENNATLLHVFPNPNTGKLFVENGSASEIEFKIYDVHGTLVLSEQIYPGLTEKDISYFANGVYFIKTKGNTDIKPFRFVKIE
jgi:hypothetical protein